MSINTKKLAIYIPDLVVGGAERSMLKLAAGIVERGYSVDIVLGSSRGLLLDEVPNTVRLINLGAKRVLTSLPALVAYLRREKPFVILSVMHANLIALWATRLANVRTRVVVSERTTLSVASRNQNSNLRTRLMPLLARIFYPWADSIVAVSKGVADDLCKFLKLPIDAVEVIYNPIITPEFQAMTNATLDHPWFKPGEPPVILSVGRLCEAKNYDLLIHAFDIVNQNHPSRLMIIGDGEDRAELETLVNHFGLNRIVSLPGFILNPYPYMRKANVFVLSSRWEGLPGVLIEALYCGIPLVSTDCPSGAREILENGKYGRLVPVGDKYAVAQAIVDAIDGKEKRPVPESLKPYELQTVVNQYINVLFN